MKKTSGFKHSLYADFLLLFKCIYYRYLHKYNIENYVKHQSWEGNKSARNPDCYHLNEDDTITCLKAMLVIKQ